jgi:hypothetical protein
MNMHISTRPGARLNTFEGDTEKLIGVLPIVTEDDGTFHGHPITASKCQRLKLIVLRD